MRALVTGRAGFIGSHLADRLLARGDEVIAVDDVNDYYDPQLKWHSLEEARSKAGFSLHEGDIRDAEFIADVVTQARPPVVVHSYRNARQR